jgi:hypothetical protein
MVMADIKATRAGQEKMGASVSSNWSELKRDHKNRVEDFLSSVEQWTQDLCEELNAKTEETQLI